MILDAIVDFFVVLIDMIVAMIIACIVPPFVLVVNLLAAAVEAVVGIFVAGFCLGRIKRKNRKDKEPSSDQVQITGVSSIGVGLILLFAIGYLVVPKVMNRTVTLLAVDGRSLPFAKLMIATDDGDQHQRTDASGNIVIPRFGTTSITVKDPRYVEQTWKKSEIAAQLTVSRTVLGAGLDSLADQLLRPAKE